MKFADGKTSSANVPHLNVWGFDKSHSRISAAEKTSVGRSFFSAREILLRIYQNPIYLNGNRWRTRFWRQREVRRRKNVVRQRAPFKCMGFWYICCRISAAEKNGGFGVNRP